MSDNVFASFYLGFDHGEYDEKTGLPYMDEPPRSILDAFEYKRGYSAGRIIEKTKREARSNNG